MTVNANSSKAGITPVGFFVVTLLLLFLPTLTLVKVCRCTIRTDAVICDSINRSNGEGSSYSAVYEYTIDGKTYTANGLMQTSSHPKIGKHVTLLVNPDDRREVFCFPTDAILSGISFSIWLVFLFAFISGLKRGKQPALPTYSRPNIDDPESISELRGQISRSYSEHPAMMKFMTGMLSKSDSRTHEEQVMYELLTEEKARQERSSSLNGSVTGSDSSKKQNDTPWELK